MDRDQIYNVMVNEYREACRDHYESRYGEKVSASYTIKNKKTGESITGDVSGCHENEAAMEVMITISRMMTAIFGMDIRAELEKIRQEERKKEKAFFKENPQYITYVTDIR